MQKVEYQTMPFLEINPQFLALIPPLHEAELELLEASIIKEGCRDPLVVWGRVLIDGHNRYNICLRNNIPFQTVNRDFNDEEEAADWIDANQLGRRNLTPDQMSLIRGRRYNRLKKPQGDSGRFSPSCQNGSMGTAEKLAKEQGVSERTIYRDAKAAAILDQHPDKAAAVISGEKRKSEVLKEIEPKPPKEPTLCNECRKTDCICPKEEPPSKEVEKQEEMVTITKERLDDLESRLAEALAQNDEMGKIIDADDHLKAAVQDRDTWKRKYESLESRFNAQTNEFNECKKTVKRLQGAMKKLQAQIPKKEREPGEEG